MDNTYNLPDLQKAFELISAGISAEGKEKTPATKSNTKTIAAVIITIVITAIVLFTICFGVGQITFLSSALKSLKKCFLFFTSLLFFASLATLFPP